MQWTYSVVGKIPEYSPPHSQSAKLGRGIIERLDKRNYVTENLKLTTTAVSSPLKGAPVIQRRGKLNASEP